MSPRGCVLASREHRGLGLRVRSAGRRVVAAQVALKVASMGTARRFHASAAVSGKLYVFDSDDKRELSTAEVYDPASDSWAQATGWSPGGDLRPSV